MDLIHKVLHQLRIRRLGLPRTTVFRLALAYAGLYILVTGITLGLVYWSTSTQLYAQIDSGLQAESGALVTLYHARGLQALREAIAKRSTRAARLASDRQNAGQRHYLLLGPENHKLAGDLNRWPASFTSQKTWATLKVKDVSPAEWADPDDPPDSKTLDWRIRAHITTLPGGYHLIIGQALNEADELNHHILDSILAAIGVTLFSILVGGLWMGRHVLVRLKTVQQTARTIMAGDLSKRIPLGRRRDEFYDLAKTLNGMLGRINALMVDMRQVTDNVAHDLRTPLTRLRARLEMALNDPQPNTENLQETIADAIEDADSLLGTFNALLQISRLESGLSHFTLDEVDMSGICRDIQELYAPLAEDKGAKMAFELEPVRVQGHPQLLSQLVANLIDNAIKYCDSKSGLITLTVGQISGRAQLTVSDNGPGIPSRAREKVFDRFTRLDYSRSTPGNGLGLSLVRAVMKLHQGTIRLDDNHPGLRVILEFPAAPRPATTEI